MAGYPTSGDVLHGTLLIGTWLGGTRLGGTGITPPAPAGPSRSADTDIYGSGAIDVGPWRFEPDGAITPADVEVIETIMIIIASEILDE